PACACTAVPKARPAKRRAWRAGRRAGEWDQVCRLGPGGRNSGGNRCPERRGWIRRQQSHQE
ncbi:unnamed protein product, partial [Effrenium voratum]